MPARSLCPDCGAPQHDPPAPCPAAGLRQPTPPLARNDSWVTTDQAGPPPAPAAPPPAAFGDYELLEEIARGGMGVVYKARQLSLNRTVALKMIRSANLASPDEIRRFQTEAQAAAALDHPNIVPIYEVGEHNGEHWFSMKLIAGASLADRPRPGPRAAAALVEAVARAVHHAHQRGVLHRDLKPSNVLLDDAGTPYLTDFGLAKRVAGDSALTLSGAVLGSPAYMAPEQADGRRDLTTAVDVFGLGAVLYHLLTGRAPYQGANVVETLLLARQAEPARPRQLAPGVPPDLETICLKCLQKDPHRRYASAVAVADDLGRYLTGRPIQARPAGAAERLAKWARRRPGPAAGALAALAALLGAVAFAAWHVHRLELARRAAEDSEARAVAQLYHTLVGQARAVRLARGEGHRDEAWRLLARARELDTPQRDLDALRAEAAASLGDPLGRAAPTWDDFDADLRAVCFLPEGRVALALHDGTVRVRDAATGAELARWKAHPGAVDALAVAADGRLATGGRDGVVKVWRRDGARWACARELRAEPWVRNLAFMPGGAELVVACDGDERALQGSCATWALSDGKPVRRWAGAAGDEPVRRMALSPDGRRLAVGYHRGDRHGVTLYDTATGRLVRSVATPYRYIAELGFRDGGRQLAVASIDGVQLIDVATGEARLFARSPVTMSVTADPGGRTVAYPVWQAHATRLWDVEANRVTAELPHPGGPFRLAFAPAGDALAVISDRAVRVWRLAPGGEKRVLTDHRLGANTAAFSPDGRLLATGGNDRTVRLYDGATAAPVRVLGGFAGGVRQVAFSPDGRLLATGDWGRQLRFWEVRTWRELPAPTHELRNIDAVAFSRDGTRFAAAGERGVVLWRTPVRAGEGVWLSRRSSSAVEFSPDGGLLIWSEHEGSILGPFGTCRAWDVAAGRAADVGGFTLAKSPGASAFTGDGRRLAFVGASQAVEVWGLGEGRLERTFALGPPAVRRRRGALVPTDVFVAVSGGGGMLARAGARVSLFDAATGRWLVALPDEPLPVYCLAWRPDGGRLVVGSGGAVAVWDIPAVRRQLAEVGLDW